ncbi:MAG: hypothetical protein HY928_10955 [Elusimicrobia bacterium]|nr:hypothetical protein [Elusimicrobiota bacterium]
MRRAALALTLLALGCSSPAPTYHASDPLSGSRPPTPLNGFSAVLPEGYLPSEGVMGDPVAAMLRRDTPYGEAAIVAERYRAPISREDFVAHLKEGPAPKASRHEAFTVYHGLPFELGERNIPPDDPWASTLGGRFAPPRLSPLEGRRFLVGGEAYRVWRCEKLNAWGVLGDYRRAQRRGKVDEFRASHPPEDRRLVSACFGGVVSRLVAEGKPVPAIPRPSMMGLRALARQEWERGTVIRRERQCVAVVDSKDGFWALRLRAPDIGFETEHEAFLGFLAAFQEK